MAYAPTLTPLPAAGPVPQVRGLFSSFATGTQTVNVTRVSDGREWPVRGAQALYAVGGAGFTDYEAPFNIPSVYRAQMFDASGTPLGFTDAASTTLTVTQFWVHQPLNPSLGLAVWLQASAARELVRSTPGEVVLPEGATVGVWVGGRRQGLANVRLDAITDTLADADEFQSLFGGYTSQQVPVICIRSPGKVRIPATLFAAVPSVLERDMNVELGGTQTTFELTGFEVAPPSPGLVVPVLRRMDIDAAFATRGARAAAYATRLARDLDFSKAGLAGR